ncbi:hypothetical protein [Planococcus dechangensis]|uniref:RDD domain-containing protein n=1 Tax=Planococcus dechangensis TaxID=1176255 RepID=A0ABV9MCA5_9BACL
MYTSFPQTPISLSGSGIEYLYRTLYFDLLVFIILQLYLAVLRFRLYSETGGADNTSALLVIAKDRLKPKRQLALFTIILKAYSIIQAGKAIVVKSTRSGDQF